MLVDKAYAITGYELHHIVRGDYRFEFDLEPAALYCRHLDIRLTPEEFDVMEAIRIEGDGEEEHMLYLITSVNDVNGILTLDLHHVFEEGMSFEMAVKLRTHPYGEWICS